MAATSQTRIEVYERSRRVLLSPKPPVLSTSLLPGGALLLEKYTILQAAEYRERESGMHLLFLSDSEPVHTRCRMGGRWWNGQTQPGDVWILPRSMPYDAIFEGPHGGLVLSISNPLFERHTGALMHDRQIELRPHFNLRDKQLEHLLLGLLAVTQDRPQPDTLVGELLVNAICVRLANRYAVSKLSMMPRPGGLSVGQLRRVLDYISANLDSNISLSGLANTANLSLYHFASSFKKSTGQSPQRYVLLQKIRRAQQLLSDKRRSVLEVALDLGFAHQGNFSRAFRRITGMSPNQFRHDHVCEKFIERIEQDRKIG